MLTSVFFLCYNLNAGLEPCVCGLYATRLPHLRPRVSLSIPRLPVHTLSLPVYSLSTWISLSCSSFSLLSLFLYLDSFSLYFLLTRLRVSYLDSGDRGFHSIFRI